MHSIHTDEHFKAGKQKLMPMSSWGVGRARVPFLSFSIFPPLLGKSEDQGWKFPHVALCHLHVSLWSFVYSLTSQSFCHQLILKLERKGMEGQIANIRGFWKFPFYGTRVFKNSSLSVVFL